MTGFEPATSASRTQRSTKLSHTSITACSLQARIIISVLQHFVNKKIKYSAKICNSSVFGRTVTESQPEISACPVKIILLRRRARGFPGPQFNSYADSPNCGRFSYSVSTNRRKAFLPSASQENTPASSSTWTNTRPISFFRISTTVSSLTVSYRGKNSSTQGMCFSNSG